MKKWEGRWFSTGSKGTMGSSIVIDHRFSDAVQPGEYSYSAKDVRVYETANKAKYFTPIVVMNYSERYTIEEFEALAHVVKDRLNAWETEKKLKGEA